MPVNLLEKKKPFTKKYSFSSFLFTVQKEHLPWKILKMEFNMISVSFLLIKGNGSLKFSVCLLHYVALPVGSSSLPICREMIWGCLSLQMMIQLHKTSVNLCGILTALIRKGSNFLQIQRAAKRLSVLLQCLTYVILNRGGIHHFFLIFPTLLCFPIALKWIDLSFQSGACY